MSEPEMEIFEDFPSTRQGNYTRASSVARIMHLLRGSKAFPVLLALLTTLLLFQYGAVEPEDQGYTGQELQWHESESCPGALARHGRLTIHGTPTQFLRLRCNSNWFAAHGEVMDLYYASRFLVRNGTAVIFELRSKNGVVARHRVHPGSAKGFWGRWRTAVPAEVSELRLTAIVRGRRVDEVSLQSRVDFWKHESRPLWAALNRARGALGLAFAAAVLLALAVSIIGAWRGSLVAPLAFFAAASVLIHYRDTVFFHADEWLFIQRMRELGPPALLLRHNEHFIPIASLLYYLQYLLFGPRYGAFVTFSALMHGINAVLLVMLLSRLAGGRTHGAKWAAGLLYLVSVNHCESIQWALCQGNILATTFALAALLTLWEFLRSRRRFFLAASCLSTLFATLSFAIGFVLFVLLPLLLVVWRIASDERIERSTIRDVAVFFGATLVIAALLYLGHKDGFQHGELNRSLLDDPAKLVEFTLFGSQFGTVLRGTGLYPYPELQALLKPGGKDGILHTAAIRWASAAGVSVSLLLLGLYWHVGSRTRRAWRLSLWTFGQCWIVLPIALIGLGRAHLPLAYAETLRYQAFPMLGLMFVLLPLLLSLTPQPMTSGASLRRALGYFVLICAVAVQLRSGYSARHFVRTGADLRQFLTRWESWADTVHSSGQPSAAGAGAEPLLYITAKKAAFRPELPPKVMAEIAER